MKLEMVSRWEELQICPVSVTKVKTSTWRRLRLVASLVLTPLLPPGLQRRLLPGNAGRRERRRYAAARRLSRQHAGHPAGAVVSEERRRLGAAAGLRGPGLRLGGVPEAERHRGRSRELLPRREFE